MVYEANVEMSASSGDKISGRDRGSYTNLFIFIFIVYRTLLRELHKDYFYSAFCDHLNQVAISSGCRLALRSSAMRLRQLLTTKLKLVLAQNGNGNCSQVGSNILELESVLRTFGIVQ